MRGAVGFAALLALASCAPSPEATTPRAQPAQTYEQNPIALPRELRDGALKSATPDEIRAAVARFGADAVVASLYGERSDQGWRRVSQNIAGGDQDWLDLAPLLRPGADGAVSEDLSISISDALQRNPIGVLRLVGGRESIDMVCRFGHLEPTEAEIAAFYGAAISAVEAVQEPELQAMKQRCLTALSRAREQDVEINRANQ